MSKIATIRVKANDIAHTQGFFIRNADDLRYGEELLMADEFEKMGEHAVRLKIAYLPPNDPLVIEGDMWLELKERNRLASDDAARSARESKTLSVAMDANRIALYAIITAITAIIVANKDQILSFIL